MRFPKVSLKKCFFITISFALLVIFVVTLRERDFWNTRSPPALRNLVASNRDQLDVRIKPDNALHQSGLENRVAGARQINEFSTKADYYEDRAFEDSQNVLGKNGDYASNSEDTVRPWYFTNGERYPRPAVRSRKTRKRLAKLLPGEDPQSDRITSQLMFMPPDYERVKSENRNKMILLYNGLQSWNVRGGSELFLNSKCPVDTCTITGNRGLTAKADMVLFKDHFIDPGVARSWSQIYMMYFLECPYHTQRVLSPSAINWTATYRRDSDIVAPYEKWEYFDMRVKQMDQERNYAQNKTKKVAWFVSNCSARNNRLNYAKELKKYIDVDIYGYCGTLKCSRMQADKCLDILDTDYKFYLAFENSNCKDYITEKFFVNALGRNILPIVMGARPEDYEKSAPYKSYIHVDEFASAKELADYLHLLDSNDELYNSYFKWKGTGEFINTYFWCRVCAMLHDQDTLSRQVKWYEDVNEWWNGMGVCTDGSWRNYNARQMTMPAD